MALKDMTRDIRQMMEDQLNKSKTKKAEKGSDDDNSEDDDDDLWDEIRKFEDNYEKSFEKLLKTLGDADWEDVAEFLVIIFQCGEHRLISDYAEEVLDKPKLTNWKAHPEVPKRLFDAMLGVANKIDDKGSYCTVTEKMIKHLKKHKLLEKHLSDLYKVMEVCVAVKGTRINNASIACAAEYPWKGDIKACKKMFETISTAVHKHPEISEKDSLCTTVEVIIIHILTQQYNTKTAAELVPILVELASFCKDQEWQDAEDVDNHTISWKVLKDILSTYVQMNCMTVDILKPFMPLVKELWKCDDEEIQGTANSIITSIGSKAELLGEDHVGELIDKYINGEDPHIIGQFSQMYKSAPEQFNDKIEDIVSAMYGGASWAAISTLTLLWEIAKANPEVVSKKAIKEIVNSLKQNDCRAMAFMVLASLSEKRTTEIITYDDDIISAMKGDPAQAQQGSQVLMHLGRTNESHAQKYLKFMTSMVTSIESMYQVGMMYNIRSIGVQYPKALGEHRKLFEELLKTPALKESAQGCIDIIEGRSLEGVSKDVAEQKEDINELDTRVTTTEENVDNLAKEVDETKEDVKQVKEDVDRQEERLDELEVVVDETVDKVEEIDHKTLSHAPEWSRQVSKLLNPEAEHDWRLLVSRLGYTPDDIRNWATQPDPCLSLLDEWFATHKTREATYAVMRTLQEMNRTDAAAIVEKALESVENLVDDEPPELINPPPIFISYQWAHQNEVKLLKKHLESAGFESWMDIGQMGGGDKLFAKIDEGVRAAKVVICCVTEKYAESTNCNREVNLSVTLGKPIIPLLMEQLQWPPAGAMGPIFGEYLFIRFFLRGKETTEDNRYWSSPKFQELLMQLRYYMPPDESLITEEYKDWWAPPEEIIIIKPKEEKKNTNASTKKEVANMEEKSPQVFISYQWGKQPQIKALYNRLAKLGYSCWLDILQMGGGDSLYDKIDKGIRGCDLVISCVTTKYSFSANCRREVSLADALKKPIVPLLLEKMAWPPEGPMGMVFSQLLYIDFCKPNAEIQSHWECPQFKELQSKIDGYLEQEANTKDMTVKTDGPQEKNTEADKGTSLESKASLPQTPRKAAQSPAPKAVEQKSRSCVLL